MTNVNFTQSVESGKLIVEFFSSDLSSASQSISINFNYSSDSLFYESSSFSGSSSTSTSSSTTNGSGTVNLSGSFSSTTTNDQPFLTLSFTGTGSGNFDLDFNTFLIGGVTPQYADPSSVTYNIPVTIDNQNISLNEDGSFSGTYDPFNSFFGSDLTIKTNPNYGTLEIISSSFDGDSWIYTPSNNYYGQDTFSITANDGLQSRTVTITAYVQSVRDDLTLNGTTGNDILKGDLIDAGSYDTLNGLDGTDTLTGLAGNDAINGGGGIDTAVFSGNLSAYTLTRTGSTYTVHDNSGRDGTDTLTSIERLQFSDKMIALDLAPTDNAGQAVLFIGVLAPDLVATPDIVGLILDFVDDGMSMQQLNQLAVDIGLVHDLAGGSSNADVASMAFENVVGVQATPDMIDLLVGFMDGRHASFSQSEFLTAVGNLEVNQANVDLVGLAQTGIEYAVG